MMMMRWYAWWRLIILSDDGCDGVMMLMINVGHDSCVLYK